MTATPRNSDWEIDDISMFGSVCIEESWRYPVVSILSQFNDQFPVSSVTSADC